jgi:chromate transporter
VLLWAIAQGALFAVFGPEGTLTRMGWFFSKAALVTFGGAYAVLPYIQQTAVAYAWLTPAQMIDGLALGETTPGPLIMVVAFVGFTGAWGHAALGPDALLLAGVTGAAVATFFTFLPSFLFILVGAPIVEATRHSIALTAPLAGITAAVVGVIANLAVYFAYHVLWPRGIATPLEARAVLDGLDPLAAALGVAAFVALQRYKLGVIPVIAGCGLVGWLRAVLG